MAKKCVSCNKNKQQKHSDKCYNCEHGKRERCKTCNGFTTEGFTDTCYDCWKEEKRKEELQDKKIEENDTLIRAAESMYFERNNYWICGNCHEKITESPETHSYLLEHRTLICRKCCNVKFPVSKWDTRICSFPPIMAHDFHKLD